jgi:hypothetical protein
MDMSSYGPGTFCWVELATTDAAAARSFYGEIFGWSTKEASAGSGTSGLVALRAGKVVAGLRAQAGASACSAFVSVANADDAARRAASLGAAIVSPAAGAGDAGRFAVLRDPTGAELRLWQPKQHQGSAIVNEAGSVCWTELATTDTARAAAFYTALFGWGTTTVDVGPVRYTEFLAGERPVAGMQRITEDWGPIAPHWLVFFAVDDCDGTAAHVKALGGDVKMPPTDLPRMGRFAVLSDPQGASFAIFQLGAAS